MALNAVMTSDVRTEAEWMDTDPVIIKNCVAYVSDKNNQYKIGDGVSKFSELPYSGGGGSGGTSIVVSTEQPEGPCLWFEEVNVF